MICPLLLFAAFAVAPSSSVQAQPHQYAAVPDTAAAGYADGEVRKVDEGARKLTLRHGPIANLGMGSMTMVFGMKDPAVLERVKAGDKVRFRAEQTGGELQVTELVPAK